MIHITEEDRSSADSVCGGENDQPSHLLVATTGFTTTTTKGPAVYELLNAYAVRAEHEIAIAEANLLLAHRPEREIRPGRVTRLRNWVAARHQDRQLVAARQQLSTARPSLAGDRRNG